MTDVDGSAAAAALEAAHARERALLEQVQQLQADLAAARRQWPIRPRCSSRRA